MKSERTRQENVKAATEDKMKHEHTEKRKPKKPQWLNAMIAKIVFALQNTVYFALQQNVKLSPNSKFGKYT